MTNITEAASQASRILKDADIPNHRMEARSLLSLALGKDTTFLIAHNDDELTDNELKLFLDLVARRANREPFQHIAGKQEFYGLDFKVSSAVLIPRPETELIVEAGIEILSEKTEPRFCEIGVGSGCISISILKNSEDAQGVATDVSAAAIDVAELNARKHGVNDRLDLKSSDLFAKLGHTRFDLIVSNPPYIRAGDFDDLQPEVRDHDPRIALTDEKDGLSIIEGIAKDSPKHLREDGWLLIEFGIDQSGAVEQLFSSRIWTAVTFVNDLQGIPRMVRAQIR
ncbi:MAG: peptide chain release factor N(5)-glutamine methyltransferase [Pyrinomonadaceae bacterium]|nr:peptide chain release factor N(5)-glutamine methyltransferase [Pyrinomonadaceae bacterium]